MSPSDLIDAWLSVAFCLASPAVASFGHLFANRMAAGEHGALWGRSCCDHCGRPLGWAELVPILSWLWLRGQSRCCAKPLEARHLGVEAAALAGALWAVLMTSGPVLAISIGLFWVLMALSLIDLATWRLPDMGTLGLVLAGLGLSLAGLTGPVGSHALGTVLGFTCIYGLRWIWQRLRGVEAIGLGDAKLLAAAGAWLGVAALPSVLLWACLAGFVLALGAGRALDLRMAVPFGPALAFGFWVTWLHGPLVLAG